MRCIVRNAAAAALALALLSACGGSAPGETVAADKAMTRTQKQIASSYENDVQQLYVAYFGRPADPAGLANFESALAAVNAPTDIQSLAQAYNGNTAIQGLIDSFGTSKESQTLYGSGTTQQFVTAIFQNVLGRAPLASGLAYWSNAIDGGTLSRGDAALAIMAGGLSNSTAQGQLDAQLINNRIAAASYFTAQVTSQGVVGSYAGSAAAASARSLLSQVTATSTLAALQGTIANAVSALVQPGIYVLAGSSGYYNPNAVDVFQNLGAVAADASGNLFVVDPNADVIWKVTPSGMTLFAGTMWSCGSTDGTGSAAKFCGPAGITVDAVGNLYVADAALGAIRKVTPDGNVSTLAPAGTNGLPSPQTSGYMQDIVIDKAGNLYVTVTYQCAIWKITQAGIASIFAGTPGNCGATDGTGAAVKLSYPGGLAIDNAGNLYMTQGGSISGTPTIPATIRKISPQGVVSTVSVSGLAFPGSITVDNSGNLIFNDGGNVMEITPSGALQQLAVSSQLGGDAYPFGHIGELTSDPSGNIYVTDIASMAVRKITPSGAVSTAAGQEGTFGFADGTGSAARFNFPEGIALDASGNVYVSDSENRTIRKIAPDGTTATLAGKYGVVGSVDGNGAAASFSSPYGMAVDGTGNLFVTDNFAHVVRKIAPDGTVTTLAGNPLKADSVDGIGSAALFDYPNCIAVDSQGNLFVGDGTAVRKITSGSVVTTFAGVAGAVGETDGAGTSARFGVIGGMTIDSADNLYVTDTGNETIRKITPAGVVSTEAKALPAALAYNPALGLNINIQGIARDSSGNFYVTETWNQVLIKVPPTGQPTVVAGTPTSGSVGLVNIPGALPGAFSLVGYVAIDARGTLYMTASDAVFKIKLN